MQLVFRCCFCDQYDLCVVTATILMPFLLSNTTGSICVMGLSINMVGRNDAFLQMFMCLNNLAEPSNGCCTGTYKELSVAFALSIKCLTQKAS